MYPLPRGIRLAFCGASGTGKSTLAEAIAKLCAYPICPVGSRSVSQAMGFASPYDVDAAGQRVQFQHELLKQKSDWEQEHVQSCFVTDRTHLDNLTYTQMHAPVAAIEPTFLRAILDASDCYTHIVFCPTSALHNTANDPARVADDAYHKRYETILTALMHEHVRTTPILWLTSSVSEVRLSQVLKFIRP